MVAHEVYALVHDETIRDVCVAYSYEDANRVARIVYGDTAFAVDCMQYVCERNDKYINGVFFKADGVTVIDRLPTDKEGIQQLRADNAQLTVAMADIIGGAV